MALLSRIDNSNQFEDDTQPAPALVTSNELAVNSLDLPNIFEVPINQRVLNNSVDERYYPIRGNTAINVIQIDKPLIEDRVQLSNIAMEIQSRMKSNQLSNVKLLVPELIDGKPTYIYKDHTFLEWQHPVEMIEGTPVVRNVKGGPMSITPSSIVLWQGRFIPKMPGVKTLNSGEWSSTVLKPQTERRWVAES